MNIKNSKDQQPQPDPVVEEKPFLRILKFEDNDYYYEISQSILSLGIFKILEFLISDDDLEEIMYDGPSQPIRVYHKRFGMCKTSAHIDENTALYLIRWIVQSNNKTISQENPIFDGTLYDGSRVNITIPPASPRNSTITIRKFRSSLITVLDLIKGGSISEDTASFIWTAIEGLSYKPSNMLIVGGTGSGKTTFLNAISMFIPRMSRIVTIEDTPEIKLKHSNILTMVSKKEQNITMDLLLKNALRQRPDRIMVGEVRGPEAITLFGAMNTGHDGCMGTLHANTARECIDRVTNPPMNVPTIMMNALDLIIVLKKVNAPEGMKRIVSEITEISSSGGDVKFNQIFAYDPRSNKLKSTKIPSSIRENLTKQAGITAKQFDFIIKDRTQFLKRIQEIDKEKEISENQLFDLIEKNKTHWKDMLEKSAIDKFKSFIKRLQKKEDIIYR